MKSACVLTGSCFLFLLSLAAPAFSHSIAPPRAVEIQTLRASVSPQAKDTAQIVVAVHSAPGGRVDLSARCAEGARLAASSKSSFSLELAAGDIAEQTFEFIIPTEGSSRIFFSVETAEAPDGYTNSDERFLTVVSRDGKTEFFDSHEPSTGKARSIHPHQGPLMERASSKTTMHHTVSFTGKFLFQYPTDESHQDYGVDGAGCRFWFYNSSLQDWWHPILGNLRHTHYDYLAEDGSFSFNFEFDADLSGYDQIWIRVSCANEATIYARAG